MAKSPRIENKLKDMTKKSPSAVVVLAAGRGSRLSPLTDHHHKSLLPIAGKPGIEWILENVCSSSAEEIVVVTGFRRDEVQSFVTGKFGTRVSFIDNPDFLTDGNILSVELGVNSLNAPERGYLIVESDMFVEPLGWQAILSIENRSDSFWVTKSFYTEVLTGGALSSGADSRVKKLVYAPAFDKQYEGMRKLLGVLYVGESNVELDRQIRGEYLSRSISQYYMVPWIENLARLPCHHFDIGSLRAVSYNDEFAYRRANELALNLPLMTDNIRLGKDED